MISAVDSSVILDVVMDDPEFADLSERVLRQAASEGQLVLCECVLAAIFLAFDSAAVVAGFLSDWQFLFVPSSEQSASLAGEHFRSYLNRGGSQKRVVADFLIGAHAQCCADRLIARDRGFPRDYPPSPESPVARVAPKSVG